MYYTYVLVSLKNQKLYIGNTSNLRQRVQDHNAGKGGRYTSHNRPFKLVFYEAFYSRSDSIKQERFYKSGYGKEVLHDKIEDSLRIIWEIV